MQRRLDRDEIGDAARLAPGEEVRVYAHVGGAGVVVLDGTEKVGVMPRGLDRALIVALSAPDWIKNARATLITGPTGVGKSWIACALGHRACRNDFSVIYHRCAGVPTPERTVDPAAIAELAQPPAIREQCR